MGHVFLIFMFSSYPARWVRIPGSPPNLFFRKVPSPDMFFSESYHRHRFFSESYVQSPQDLFSESYRCLHIFFIKVTVIWILFRKITAIWIFFHESYRHLNLVSESYRRRNLGRRLKKAEWSWRRHRLWSGNLGANVMICCTYKVL
jgi:hypothetical protein